MTTVPYFKPHIGQAEIDEVTDCLKNGWLTTGNKTKLFESKMTEFLGGNVHCVAINSATAGLHLALEACGVGPGDEVIVPDYTFTATAEVVRHVGAHPVFIDIDYQTLNVTAQTIEAAVTKKTKAIIPVHFAGLPCDMPAILEVAKKHNLKVVEDAAHALPASCGGIQVGQFDSDASVLSFYANKTITTGEGGMLITKNEAIAKRARVMALHGFDRDAFDRFKTGSWAYDIVAPGYKYNLTDIASAIGLHQLEKATFFQEERQKVAMKYLEGLSDLPLDLPSSAPDDDLHSWHLFIIRLNEMSGLSRDELFKALGEANITCSVHYTPLHEFTYWRDTYSLSASDFPNAERAGANAISLPLFVGMEDAQIDHVISTIRHILTS